MSAFLLGWFRLIWLFTRGHQALVLENLALRQQLAVYKRHSKRPRLRRSDRMFWIVLAGLWKGWRRALVARRFSLRNWRVGSEMKSPGREDLGFDAFCRWFDFQHHSMLVDLCDEPLIDELD
jgi:hypothetical protein